MSTTGRKNNLGAIRRGQVLGIYGPGSIVDFRSGKQGGGPVSIMPAGLEHWDISAQPSFPTHSQQITDPRLQKQLDVDGFRLPPVEVNDGNNEEYYSNQKLIGIRFPKMLQCPNCNEIKYYSQWGKEIGDPSRWCDKCSEKNRVHAIPSRFITACINGHVSEFPWDYWYSGISHDTECKKNHRMKLANRGGSSLGLSGLHLICLDCKKSRSLEGVFSEDALQISCKGERPWLDSKPETCSERPRTLQRGASNLYFPCEVSALDIPPWSDAFQKKLGTYWTVIANISSSKERISLINSLDKTLNLTSVLNKSSEEINNLVERSINYLNDPNRSDNLKFDEYAQFTKTGDYFQSDNNPDNEFDSRDEKVPESLIPWIGKLLKIVKLREIRALTGFTRIFPPASSSTGGKSNLCDISSNKQKWLPAVEVRGEGIFIELNLNSLERWEKDKNLIERAKTINDVYVSDYSKKFENKSLPPIDISPRYILIHTLSHALIRQLSLECGYSTSSMKERVYADSRNSNMAGLLIYTATSDTDGTLGGLARQASETRFEKIFIKAIKNLNWCSSDPLCITNMENILEDYNLAACHSCLLVPETSCEEYNRFLDRAAIIGTPDSKCKGFIESIK